MFALSVQIDCKPFEDNNHVLYVFYFLPISLSIALVPLSEYKLIDQ